MSIVLLAAMLVPILATGGAGAEVPSLDVSNFEITDTAAGQQIAAEATQRWQDNGWISAKDGPIAQQRTRVYELNAGDYLVVPERVKVTLKWVDGKVEPVISTFCPANPPTNAKMTSDVSSQTGSRGTHPTAVKMTPGAFSVAAYDWDGNHYISMWEALEAVNDYNYYGITLTQRDQVVNAWLNNTPVYPYTGPPYWSLVDQYCFSRVENSTGWLDECYMTYKLIGNLDPTYDYYSLRHWCTAESKSVWALHWAKVESVASASSAPQEWVDWDPKGDIQTQNCSSIGLSVNVLGVSIGASHTICPAEWDISKGIAAGTFSCKWVGNARQSERYAAYMITIKVGECHWPVWDLTPGFNCELL